jgi:REP element-mobilizing transposase RayT
MARPIRIEYPGAVYHVICRGNNRQAIYRDDDDRRRYLEKLSHYCQDKKVDLLAYCLMSNHASFVGDPGRESIENDAGVSDESYGLLQQASRPDRPCF